MQLGSGAPFISYQESLTCLNENSRQAGADWSPKPAETEAIEIRPQRLEGLLVAKSKLKSPSG